MIIMNSEESELLYRTRKRIPEESLKFIESRFSRIVAHVGWHFLNVYREVHQAVESVQKLEIQRISGIEWIHSIQTLDLFRIQCDLMHRRRWGVRASEGWTSTAATMGRTSPRWRVVQACMYRDRFRFSIMCFELCMTFNFQVSTCNFQVNFQPSPFDWLQVYCCCILSVWLSL